MVKRKIKKAIRQKQKVKVSQNVKVVIGDIKKKRAVKSSGAKAGAKPPLVLNISNPQPLNNMFMEYFKKQLQNQEPIKANTLAQQEASNEREETKASKAGALHRLDQEPNDLARDNRKQGEALKARINASMNERKQTMIEVRSSLKPVADRKVSPTPLRPRQQTQRELLMSSIRTKVSETPPASTNEARPDTIVLNYMKHQQQELEDAMEQAVAEQEDEDEQEPRAFIPSPAPQPPVTKGRGRPKYTEEQKKEAQERKTMLNEDPVGQDLLKRQRSEKKLKKLQQ